MNGKFGKSILLTLVGVVLWFLLTGPPTSDVGPIRGNLYEILKVPDRLAVEIYSYGFADAGFDAYLVKPQGRIQIVHSLGFAPGQYDFQASRPNLTEINSAGKFFGVYWSANGERFAVTNNGFNVAAYDVKSGRTLRWENRKLRGRDWEAREYTKYHHDFDSEMERFVRGANVTTASLEAIANKYDAPEVPR